MCDTSNITVGTIVMVKVGRNEIEVVVTAVSYTHLTLPTILLV